MTRDRLMELREIAERRDLTDESFGKSAKA